MGTNGNGHAQPAPFRNEPLADFSREENRTAMQAIGYRQVVEHLRGERSLPETIDLVKIRTRQFAKRQMTWFRREPEVAWLEGFGDDPTIQQRAAALAVQT